MKYDYFSLVTRISSGVFAGIAVEYATHNSSAAMFTGLAVWVGILSICISIENVLKK